MDEPAQIFAPPSDKVGGLPFEVVRVKKQKKRKKQQQRSPQQPQRSGDAAVNDRKPMFATDSVGVIAGEGEEDSSEADEMLLPPTPLRNTLGGSSVVTGEDDESDSDDDAVVLPFTIAGHGTSAVVAGEGGAGGGGEDGSEEADADVVVLPGTGGGVPTITEAPQSQPGARLVDSANVIIGEDDEDDRELPEHIGPVLSEDIVSPFAAPTVEQQPPIKRRWQGFWKRLASSHLVLPNAAESNLPPAHSPEEQSLRTSNLAARRALVTSMYHVYESLGRELTTWNTALNENVRLTAAAAKDIHTSNVHLRDLAASLADARVFMLTHFHREKRAPIGPSPDQQH